MGPGKVMFLEKIVTDMALQLISLKNELNDMKKDKTSKENIETEGNETNSINWEMKAIVTVKIIPKLWWKK